MKNILAENMLRFGVKNLSELSKHRLMEAIVELIADANAANALKSLKAQIVKGIKLPSVRMGQYYLKVQSNELTDNGQIARGKVVGLHGKVIGGVGTLPVPSNFTLNEGGTLEFGINGPWSILNFDTTQLALPSGLPQIAAAINTACNQCPVAELTAMLASHPKKAVFETGIAAFKASNSAIKPLLTGNAKAFYGV